MAEKKSELSIYLTFIHRVRFILSIEYSIKKA